MSQTPNRKRSQIFCHQVKSTLSICQHVPLTGYSLAGRRLRWSVVSQIGREELMAALRVSGLLCRHHPLMARILSAQDSVCSNNLIPPLLSGKRTLPTKGRIPLRNRMNFWKSAKGGGSHFQTKNLYCRF